MTDLLGTSTGYPDQQKWSAIVPASPIAVGRRLQLAHRDAKLCSASGSVPTFASLPSAAEAIRLLSLPGWTAVGNQSGGRALSPRISGSVFCSLFVPGALPLGMPYIPPIPKAHLETYRAAARAYRAARRLGARQHEWHWAAVREVIKRHPEMTHREADSFAQSIIRYVSLYYGTWFWN